MDKKFLGLLGVLALIAVVALGVGWLNSSRDDDQNTVYIIRTVEPANAIEGNAKFVECVKAASKRLQAMPGVDISEEQAIAQAKTSPRCSPLR